MKIVGTPEPGKAVVVDGNPVMTVGDVWVRPVTDVVKGKEAVALPGGELAMREPGDIPGDAVLIKDCEWGSTAKAGELALLCCGIAMRKAIEAVHKRARLIDLGLIEEEE